VIGLGFAYLFSRHVTNGHRSCIGNAVSFQWKTWNTHALEEKSHRTMGSNAFRCDGFCLGDWESTGVGVYTISPIAQRLAGCNSP
jgi:hypothetical protein